MRARHALGFIERHGCRHPQAHRAPSPAGSSSYEQGCKTDQQVRCECSKVSTQERLHHQAKQGECAVSIALSDVRHFLRSRLPRLRREDRQEDSDSGDHVAPSSNAYDWLGAGAYFWENSPKRALSWAEFLKKHPVIADHKIETPFVIGAIIDLGNCFDLSDAGSLAIIRNGYEQFKAISESAGAQLPVNEPAHDEDTDLVKRHLDCAVMNFVHALRDQSDLRPFDTGARNLHRR